MITCDETCMYLRVWQLMSLLCKIFLQEQCVFHRRFFWSSKQLQLLPWKIAPRLGLRFGLGLVLGLEGSFLEGNCPTTICFYHNPHYTDIINKTKNITITRYYYIFPLPEKNEKIKTN